MPDTEVTLIEEVIDMALHQKDLHFLVISYEPENPASGGGLVFTRSPAPAEKSLCILSTNDPVRCISCSNNGNLWMGSLYGLIWTTAATGWPSTDDTGVDFAMPEGNRNWCFYALPKTDDDGFYQAIAIEAFDDGCVFVGTSNGNLFHWNGKDWKRFDTNTKDRVGKIRAFAKDNVWASFSNQVFHFDGEHWSKVPTASVINGAIVGFEKSQDGSDIIACASRGELYKGSPQGLSLWLDLPQTFASMCWHQDRLLLAVSNQGLAELKNGKLHFLCKTPQPVFALCSNGAHVYSVIPSKQAEYGEYTITASAAAGKVWSY